MSAAIHPWITFQDNGVPVSVADALPGIDFLEAVKRDWEIYRPRVPPGGVVILHDILDMPSEPWLRVDVLWADVKAAGYRTEEWYIDRQQGVYVTGVVHV